MNNILVVNFDTNVGEVVDMFSVLICQPSVWTIYLKLIWWLLTYTCFSDLEQFLRLQKNVEKIWKVMFYIWICVYWGFSFLVCTVTLSVCVCVDKYGETRNTNFSMHAWHVGIDLCLLVCVHMVLMVVLIFYQHVSFTGSCQSWTSVRLEDITTIRPRQAKYQSTSKCKQVIDRNKKF